jgi:hypothetical protein
MEKTSTKPELQLLIPDEPATHQLQNIPETKSERSSSVSSNKNINVMN